MGREYSENNWRGKILGYLSYLYGSQSEAILKSIEALLERHNNGRKPPKALTEKDIMLITYGDSIFEDGKPPLETLNQFLNTFLKNIISIVHILPFYPYSSDDGFSVIDYRQVDPKLGDWSHIKELATNFALMFDAVVNHISKSSKWFQGYLKGDQKYKNYFIEADPSEDWSKVTRPRALPLLTSFNTADGQKYVWTTFSSDQIDLNYKNPEVLLEVIDTLLFYISNGASCLRLDAIGYLWKKKGTTCLNLQETHVVVKLLRSVLEKAAPGTILITETNVPHRENIAYFGNGYDEAHLVYQFPLPPLTLFSFYTGNARKLLEWLATVEPTSNETTFLNFLASHDGIGMLPTRGILTDAERDLMIEKTLARGGYVSYKDNGDGTKSPYELNINYFSALSPEDEEEETWVNRFLAAHAILLSVVGVPGIYIHSLVGSDNYVQGVKETGIYRRINREKLEKDRLFRELQTETIRRKVFSGLKQLIQLRKGQRAFSPQARQEVLFLDDRIFSLIRRNEASGEQILVLVNVTGDKVALHVPYSGKDLISNKQVGNELVLLPYQVMWVKN